MKLRAFKMIQARKNQTSGLLFWLGMSLLASPFTFDADWISLQKEIRDDDTDLLTGQPSVRHFGPHIHDFSDTAAIIAQMDLVIAVDTSVAHLAGAMGKPVWILLPKLPDWRWLLHRSDSPWYPSARLFRQRHRGDWAGVVRSVQRALAQRYAR